MLYTKEGYPEEDELVLCTVSKIHFHSVFCNIDEYNNKTGLIHISEIAPGRIRNMNEHVQEGKKVVCKVLRIDEEKKHIDLSLRRVNEAQRKAKIEQIKQEQKAEKIIENFAEKIKKPVQKIYADVTKALFDDYEMLFMAFEDVVENDVDLKSKGLKKELADPLMEIVKDKIKPKSVSIGGELRAFSYAEDGVEQVKKALSDPIKKEITVTYSGAGRYKLTVVSPDYKQAEKILADYVKETKSFLEKYQGGIEFTRQ